MITNQKIKEAIVNNANHVEIESIKHDVPLEDYDIDSLDFFNIVLELQEITGIEVPDSDLEKLKTIDSIHKYFQ